MSTNVLHTFLWPTCRDLLRIGTPPIGNERPEPISTSKPYGGVIATEIGIFSLCSQDGPGWVR